MDKEPKEAIERALETEYAWVDCWNDAQYDCCLSDNFTTKMEKILKIEDPDNTMRDYSFVKPELPTGYSIAAGEKDGAFA